MKSTGIVRKLDVLGRIVLPIELRRTLGIDQQAQLEIFVENDKIVLCKYIKDKCTFCDSSEDISIYKDKNVCSKCIREMHTHIS